MMSKADDSSLSSIAPSGSLFPDDGLHISKGGKTVQEIGQLIFAEDWCSVRDAVRSDPKAASLRNWAKKTPLHMCCEQGAPLDTIRSLLRADPSVASLQDIFGYTPLHVAFVSDESSRWVARELVRACPDSLRVRDKQGYAPLHRAVSANMPVPVLLDLIEACPESVSFEAIRGGLPLDKASLPTVERIFESASQEARLWIGSVLHWACRPRTLATFDFVSVLENHPADVRAVDKRGMLPLHVAGLWWKYFPEAPLKGLIRAHPDGATVPDVKGNTPLHYACWAHNEQESWLTKEVKGEAFRELIETSGRMALMHRNDKGRTPLHLACYSRALSLGAFRMLLEACPEVIHSEDDGGRTPVVCFMDGCCETNQLMAHGLLMDEKVWRMLNVLLRRTFNDEADRRTEDDMSDTLLSCLRVQRCPLAFLWLVASHYPDQIKSRDARGRYPLHVAAAHLDGSDGASSFLLDLICHHPAALGERDDDGRYPLTYMIEAGRTWGGGVREAIIGSPRTLYDVSVGDSLLPHAMARVCGTKRLGPVFELIRGKPHKFFGCLCAGGAMK